MRKIGYARVSSSHQNLDRQIAALRAERCDRIFREKASGRTVKGRPELEKAIDQLGPGDILILAEWDRCTRSMQDGVAIIERIHARSAMVRVLDRGVTLDDLILRQIEPLLGGTDRIRLRGPSVLLTPAAAQVLSIAFHELTANCVRHGSCADPNGRVEVLWAAEPGPEGPILGIRWREYGPRASAAGPPGFGKVVLERLTPQALNGKASWGQHETGNIWSLTCPLNHAGQLK